MAEDLKNLNREASEVLPVDAGNPNNEELRLLLYQTELKKRELEAKLGNVSENINQPTTLTQSDMLEKTALNPTPSTMLNPDTSQEAEVLTLRIQRLNDLLSGNHKIDTKNSDEANELTRMTQGDLN